MIKSYSQWSTFKKCGAQYKYRYIDRIPVKAAPAAQRGTDIHAEVEALLKRETEEFSGEENPLVPYQEFFLSLREKGAQAERHFMLTEDWEPTQDKEKAMVQGVIDVVVPVPGPKLYLYELKTGKEWEDHVEQRHFYGVVSLFLEKQYEEVEVIGVYVDGQFNRSNSYTREMLGTYKYIWNERLRQMDVEEAMIPRPGPYCRWCPFSSDRGGPCKFSG